MFAHFGAAAARADQVRHLLARTDARGHRRRGRGPASPGTARRGAACSSSRGTSATGKCRRSRTRSRIEPISVLARPLDNPYLHAMLEDIRTSTGNTVIYRQGAVRRMLRDLTAGRGVAVLIDQHLHTRRDLCRVLPQAGGHDLRACRARAANRRAGDSGVRAADASRPLPLHLRAPGGSAARRHARRRPRVHAALHRRARDVRAPPSRALDVDAPPLARRSGISDRRSGIGDR